MQLLILVKEFKTQYKLLQFSMYELGQVTSSGWLVIYKGFYCNGGFLTYNELSDEYWRLYKFKVYEFKRKRNKKIFNIFKKW